MRDGLRASCERRRTLSPASAAAWWLNFGSGDGGVGAHHFHESTSSTCKSHRSGAGPPDRDGWPTPPWMKSSLLTRTAAWPYRAGGATPVTDG